MTPTFIMVQTKHEEIFLFRYTDNQMDVKAFQENGVVIITHKRGDGVGDFFAAKESISYVCCVDEEDPDSLDYNYIFDDSLLGNPEE